MGLASVSAVFVAHRIGFVLGALVGGRLYDRVNGHRVLAVALALMAAAYAALPAVPRLSVLLGVVVVVGFTAGGVDVGGNVLLIWRVRSGLGPFMSFLHFAFGVGTFLAPVFLGQSVAVSGGIQLGYIALVVVSLPVVILVVTRPPPAPVGKAPGESAEARNRPDRLLVALTVAFLMLYVAAEVGFGNWIYTYALRLDLLDEVSAAYLTSAYWGAYTIGRLLSVAVAARVRPRLLLVFCLATGSVSMLLLAIIPAGVVVTWLFTVLLGLSLAPMFPFIVTFAGERTAITGGVTSLFLVGASIGGMSLPWLIGQLFESIGPRVVPVAVLVDLLLLVSVFSIVLGRFGGPRARSGDA